MDVENRISTYLEKRVISNQLRKLMIVNDLVDFSSNDYLGFSRSAYLKQQVDIELNSFYKFKKSGATGSRLLDGNSYLADELEQLLARMHHAEAALLFNSGYDANVGLLSTVIRSGDLVFYDELIHASLHQGIKLSCSNSFCYKHNNYDELNDFLQQADKNKVKFIVSESVFSMEGDKADLKKLVHLSKQYNAHLIIDEAHSNGIFGDRGSGMCNEFELEQDCFARIYTFGKAIGSHGAVVVGSQMLIEYLINFSKNFIYTTALDSHTLLSVKHAYLYLQNNINQSVKLRKAIFYFNLCIDTLKDKYEVCGEGPIYGIIVPGNENCKKMALYLSNKGYNVRPILSPTVSKGKERLRIVLHSYNTEIEINQLISLIVDY